MIQEGEEEEENKKPFLLPCFKQIRAMNTVLKILFGHFISFRFVFNHGIKVGPRPTVGRFTTFFTTPYNLQFFF